MNVSKVEYAVPSGLDWITYTASTMVKLSILALCASANAFTSPSSAARPATALKAATATLPATVKPGVVTGDALMDLLAYAKERGFAIPAVNAVSSCGINACLEAAAKRVTVSEMIAPRTRTTSDPVPRNRNSPPTGTAAR